MKVFKFITALVMTVLCLVFASSLLCPKYASASTEGTMIERYYDEPRGHDVIFIGDCEVYETYSPQTLWDEYGITSYIRGSAQQLIWQAYYMLEDTLRYETPRVVVFNVQSLQYDRPQSEAYNRMTLDGMRWSRSKVEAIKASMTPDEHFIDYVFPLLRFHSRWNDLSADDLKYLTEKPPSPTLDGYYMRVDTLPVTTLPDARAVPPYDFGETAWSYLDRIVDLCRANYIDLVLVKAPSLYPQWYDAWDEEVAAYADEHGLIYLNFLDADLMDATGIDYSTDTYDAGLHMNIHGAEKLSRYLGQVLADRTRARDQRGEPEILALWESKRERYDAQVLAQTAAMEAAGKTVADVGERGEESSNPEESGQHETEELSPLMVPADYLGYVFWAGDVPVCVGLPWEPIVARLGDPEKTYEVSNCGFDGVSKIYSYDGFELCSDPDGEEESLYSVAILGGGFSTAEGIGIGSSVDEVIGIYGKPADYRPEISNNLTYDRQGMKLSFIMSDGAVSYIQYSNGLN